MDKGINENNSENCPMVSALGDEYEWHDRRSEAVIKEGGKEFRYNNPTHKEMCCYKIDGKVISNNTSQTRCDYLLGICHDNQIFLIELKGTDIGKAAEQINATIDFLKDKIAGYKIFGRIICSRDSHPKVRPAAFLKLEKKCALLRGNLKHGSKVLGEKE